MKFALREKGPGIKMDESILYDEGPALHGLLANPRTILEVNEYLDPELPKFAGNPCIGSLPPINTRTRAINSLLRLPDYNEEMRLADAHLRPHMAMDVLHFFQPLTTHLKLEGMLSRLIRDGYIDRNPLNKANSNDFKERLKYFKTHPYVGEHLAPNSSGFLVCGMSGIGKSTALSRILSLYPQILLHSNYRGKKFSQVQILMAIVECPKDGSTKSLCTEFFKTIDYILCGETNFSKELGNKHQNTADMMYSMGALARRLLLGVLVIDEIQYLNVAKSGGADEMLNFFVRLVNTIGIPVILVGTYDASQLLEGTFRQARRASGQGDLIWDPLPLSYELNSDWQLYIETLWGHQYVRNPSPLTEELSKALHDVSYGVVDIANRIYLATQIRAIETGVETITEGMVRSVYRDDFRLISHIIEILKTGNPALLQKFKDVIMPRIIPAQTSSTPSNVDNPPQPTKSEAVARDIDKENAPSASMSTTPNQDKSAASKVAVNNAPAPTTPNQSGKSRKGRRKRKTDIADVTFEQGDLRGIIARAESSTPKLHPYYALLNAGVIKKPTEFLPMRNRDGDQEKETTT